jgi:hypothetical protein
METTKELDVHLTNYRIAFDAMRAYHTSEIEHKKDMITILNGILVSIVTVFAGIFIFILSSDYDAYKRVATIFIMIIGFLYVIMIRKLMSVNAEKIKGDNNRYEKFRIECQLEREYLGLNDYYKEIKQIDNIYWFVVEDKDGERKGTGYKKTIGIINIYCDVLLYIVIALSLVALTVLAKQIF